MAIVCEHCGAQYDVALFQFGRTISCACGHRVGLRLRRPGLARGGPVRFLADEMLAGLARWLRVIGYDTKLFKHGSDADAVRLAATEGRIVLTRDRRMLSEWWVDGCYLLRSERPLDQLREVVDRFGLPWRERLFERCLRCNVVLIPLPRGSAPPGVPQSVVERGLPLRSCRQCGRVYWEGSHTARMRATLEETLEPK